LETFAALKRVETRSRRYNQGHAGDLRRLCILTQIVTKNRRKSGFTLLLRLGLPGIAAVLIAGLVAPLINGARFSGPIQRTLESALGRQVRFEAVHFSLFPGPGFSLDNVTIAEDPRFGVEPFAYVPTLQARLRVDKLIFGQLRFSSLRLVEPALNFVKRGDGAWNVVELVHRLSAPRRSPLNLFPAFEVADGRIDFKLGTRKTTLYLLDSDFSIYPERSGKLYVQFSGSPARTDRAGIGFGHLRGTVNWYLNPRDAKAKQLDADVILDPSNLSELTTLFQGHDMGVHGTLSSRARIEGPANALHVSGELHLEDVHRWDLLPSRGEDWRIGYQGIVDLVTHRLDVVTLPPHSGEPAPVGLQVRVNSFLNRPEWSILARLNKAPLEDLLPLGRRMGLSLPKDFASTGKLDGAVGYSSSTGLNGGVAISNAAATLPNVPSLHAALVNATVFPDRVHFDSATVETAVGDLEASGNYYLFKPGVAASLSVDQFPVNALKSSVNAWFGAPSGLDIFQDGDLTGRFVYQHEGSDPPSWSGEFEFANATLTPPGIATPLRGSEGRVSFDNTSLDLTRFSTTIGRQIANVSYHYSANAKRSEHVRVELPAADLMDVENSLAPTLEAQGLLARLRVTRRTVPAWLASRNLEGDLAIDQFSIGSAKLGTLNSHFIWQGTNLQFTSLQVKLTEGALHGRGTVNLASYSPQCRFNASVTGFPWRGGYLNAEGRFESSGTGAENLQHLHANGSFSGEDLNLSPDDAFSKLSGLFDFSFENGWPNLRLSKVQASDGDDAWEGEAASQSDGKLIFDLEHAGRVRRVVSTLLPDNPVRVSYSESRARVLRMGRDPRGE
jgi:hypothetical protein